MLTSTWVELISSPHLLAPRRNAYRDHRLLAISSTLVGCLCGATMVHVVGAAGTFGLAAGLRLVSATSFLFASRDDERCEARARDRESERKVKDVEKGAGADDATIRV